MDNKQYFQNNQSYANVPQNPPPVYNPYPYNNTFYQEYNKVSAALKKHSIVVGLCLLSFLVLPAILFQIARYFGFAELYEKDRLFSISLEIIIIIISVFLPFLVSLLWVKKYHKIGSLGFEKPNSKKVFYLAIPAGLMLCCLGDFVANIIVSFFLSFGIELNPVEMDVPTQGVALLAYAIQVIVVPSIIEEFAMRGLAMQPLRKYGEGFAIFSTAIIFALMHRNIVQGIFAFFAGLALGYVAIATESVWTAVIVHGLNNAFSVGTQVLSEKMPDDYINIYMASYVVIFVVGVVCLALLLFSKERHKLTNNVKFMSNGYKLKKVILTVPMVLAFIFMFIETIDYISIR